MKFFKKCLEKFINREMNAIQKEMAYDEFVRFVFSQGSVQVVQARYYDIALPDIDDASVLIDTQFKIASVKALKF